MADSIAGSEYSWNQSRLVELGLAKEQFVGKPSLEERLLAELEPRVLTTAVI